MFWVVMGLALLARLGSRGLILCMAVACLNFNTCWQTKYCVTSLIPSI
jgi:hypothetical protein